MCVPFFQSVSQLPPGSYTLPPATRADDEPKRACCVNIARSPMLHTMKRWRARTTTTLLIERTACLPVPRLGALKIRECVRSTIKSYI